MQETLIQYKYILLQEVYSRVSNVYEPNGELFVDGFQNAEVAGSENVKFVKKVINRLEKKEEKHILDWSDDCSASMWLRERPRDVRNVAHKCVSLFQRVFNQM